MRTKVFVLFIFCPMMLLGQTTFDFKKSHNDLGWVESGGANTNSGITTDGFELNWDANKTPKLRSLSANIDAESTPILAVTVKIKHCEIRNLDLAYYQSEKGKAQKYISDGYLHKTLGAITFYYDLTHTQWRNYTKENDHDFFEIGFMNINKSNLISQSTYGDLVIEKIEFLKFIPKNNANSYTFKE